MKSSIATVCLSGDLREKLVAISAAGFDGVEIFEADFLTFDGGPRDVGRMIRDHGLEITLFQPFRDFEGLPEPQRTRAFERAERKFDLMEELGTDLMLVCSNVSPLALGGIDRAAADLRELGERAGARGLRVGYEALAWGRHVSDHRDAWEIVRRADHPAVGLILDSFHTLARKIDVDTIRAIPGDRIFIVQLADAPRIDMDPLHWSRHFRTMPGQGDLALGDFMRAVLATGYAGPISLEVFNDQFRGGSPRSVAVDGKRSLVALMDRVGRSDPVAASAIDLPVLPHPIAVEGVAFIEFAADEQDADRLSRLLHSMGFSRRGRHRNRQVTLFQQGDIRFVVNTETDGFAYTSWAVHGTSAYAIGLQVEDAAATIERARALGAETFSEQRGAGEVQVPAIRGVGGGVIYFLDDRSDLARIWDIEFERLDDPAPGHPTPDVGLTRIDHVAQTMNYDEMLSWVLFYTSIFKARKLPMVDVVDPGGLVRSQVIENGEGTLRLTLNGAENRKSLAGRFLADSFGSSIQHLALGTDDILRTAEAMRALGFDPLHIPGNYYDDLEARLGLDPALVERLRGLHILYDRDEGGEFLQFYGHVQGDGFFFEIIERRGGYGGYGAPNAPFRIAAQQREMPPKGMPRR